MGKEYQEIDERIRGWIERQHLFFVSTAPLADDGRINCSPKGLDGLRVLGPRQIVYADIGGSGIETVAHLKENGRIVIMLCAFDGPPKIFRFYGRGRPLEPRDTDFERLVPMFPKIPAIRNFIIVDIDCIRDSCGYGVPLYEFKSDRESLKNWCESKTEDELLAYRIERNALSLDGLPGLDVDPGALSKSYQARRYWVADRVHSGSVVAPSPYSSLTAASGCIADVRQEYCESRIMNDCFHL